MNVACAGARLRDRFNLASAPAQFAFEWLHHRRGEMRFARRLRQRTTGGQVLVIVLSAPKTASTSVLSALGATAGNYFVTRIHHAQPEHFWPGVGCTLSTPHGGMRHRGKGSIALRPFLRRFDGELRFVSLVRDPLGFNISNFTYFGQQSWLRRHWHAARWMPAEQLAEIFFRTFPHAASSVWWQREFAQTVGYDPLKQPFDTEAGWAMARSGRTRSLIMRTDVPDERKTTLLREFLECPSVPEVRRENSNTGKAPSELGERLKAAIATRPDYVDRVLDLPAVRHFWSDAQRARMRATWLRTDAPARPALQPASAQG
jgi:hypothetical protein